MSVPVDGGGAKTPEEHASAFVDRLLDPPLSARQIESLITELRNALVPTLILSGSALVKDATGGKDMTLIRRGIVRVLAMADELRRRMDKTDDHCLPWASCRVKFAIGDERIVWEITGDHLPKGWRFDGTDRAIGDGYVVYFKVEGPLRMVDGYTVGRLLRGIGAAEKGTESE